MRFTPIPSKVYLAGAGPGDPELITVKAQRALQSAHCVLYDNLASQALVDLAPPGAEKLYVGKKRSAHAFSQAEICRMLIDRARAGATVVRLKGGDPYLFGRGGEEAEALLEAGVSFEVIPGVTSPCGIAAYAGIPLTHREHSSEVTFVTGHDPAAIDWNRTGLAETLVVLMGLTNFAEIAHRLISAGRSPETPAAAVRWGTRADQQTITGTLATLPARLQASNLKPPATVIVGAVAALHPKLAWFEQLPLFGRTVVVTRPRDQASSLIETLRELGANAVALPTIEIGAPIDPQPLRRAVAEIAGYDWIVFTSANGVHAFFAELDRSPADVRAIRGQLCAIGPATAEVLAEAHCKVDLIAEEYVAESLVQAFSSFDLRGKRVLLPRAEVARDVLPRGLAELGAEVNIVAAYRSAAPPDLAPRAQELIAALTPLDAVVFTSSSTAINLIEAAGVDALLPVRIITIGPVTSATVRRFGLTVTAQASIYTSDGIVEAIRGVT